MATSAHPRTDLVAVTAERDGSDRAIGVVVGRAVDQKLPRVPSTKRLPKRWSFGSTDSCHEHLPPELTGRMGIEPECISAGTTAAQGDRNPDPGRLCRGGRSASP
jgi:hypothetical protein